MEIFSFEIQNTILMNVKELKELNVKELNVKEKVKQQPLLVLDLDETLVFSSERFIENSNPQLKLHFHGDSIEEDCYLFIYIRPFVRQFIEFIFQHFDVGIWTAASNDYAHAILPYVFEEYYEKLKFVFTANRCIKKTYLNENVDNQIFYAVKDLKKIWKRKFNGIKYKKSQTLVIDDIAMTFSRNYGNGIQVHQFGGDENDKELFVLQKYLEYFVIHRKNDDWRKIEKRLWHSNLLLLQCLL